MADRVVIDASLALAYLTDEVATNQAQAAIADWQSSSTDLFVPSHFWIEVTNVLVGGRKVAPDQAIAAFVDLDGLGLQTIEPDRPLLLLAIDGMVRFGLTAYDAMYLALALSTKSELATLDRRLAAAAGPAGVLIGSTGVSDARVHYLAEREDYTGWAHTAVVGAHIAELRKKALAEA